MPASTINALWQPPRDGVHGLGNYSHRSRKMPTHGLVSWTAPHDVMTPEQFRRAGEIFHAALALTAERRQQFLADACGDDDLRHDVESLLAAHGDAGTFIESPP